MERVVRVKRGRHDTPSEQLLIHTDVAPPSKHARLAASLNQLATGLDSLSVVHNQGCLRPPDAATDVAAVEDAIAPTASGARAPTRSPVAVPAVGLTSKPNDPCSRTGAMHAPGWMVAAHNLACVV